VRFVLPNRVREASAADSGFTLVEAVVAILIAGFALAAVGVAVAGGVRGSTTARINQQASDVAESQLETARGQGYDNLAMNTADPTLNVGSDSRLMSSGCPNGASLCVPVPNPSGSGTVVEGLVTTPSGGWITNHVSTVTDNHVPFTVSTYVTKPSDEAGASYKRVTVYVSWSDYSVTHTRVESTIVADTRRGLPLPSFKLTPFSCNPNCSPSSNGMTITANPASTAVFGFKLSNLGARDSWDFTSDNESLGWTYYLDNGDGVLTTSGPNADSIMTDSSGNGVRDTGPIDPNAYVVMWATRDIPSTATASTSTVNFTATSVAQPNLGAGISTQTLSTTVNVQTGVISISPTPTPSSTGPSPSPSPTSTSVSANCSAIGATITGGTPYYLYNSSSQSPGNEAVTNALYPMFAGTNAPTAPTSPPSAVDYSADDGLANHDGRTLSPSNFSATNTTPAQVAAFDFQSPNGSYKLNAGDTYVDVWARPASGQSTDSVSLQAAVLWNTPTGAYKATEGTMSSALTGTGCGDWRQFVLDIPTSAFKPGNNNYISAVIENVGSTAVQLMYDTPTYNATMIWPVG
jgi:type II secretory pathway pseudopilin PulG